MGQRDLKITKELTVRQSEFVTDSLSGLNDREIAEKHSCSRHNVSQVFGLLFYKHNVYNKNALFGELMRKGIIYFVIMLMVTSPAYTVRKPRPKDTGRRTPVVVMWKRATVEDYA